MGTQKKIRIYDAIIRLCIALAFIIGFAMLFFYMYPVINRWQSNTAMLAAATTYAQKASALSQAEIDAHLYRAYSHNAELAQLPPTHILRLAERATIPHDYTDILNIAGAMARLEIERINLDLPVLHSTTPEAMLNGVGHLEGTSFPIGGNGAHSVLMTHSGKHTATLFNRLHELEYGDRFVIYVLDRRLVYEVDRIKVILPHEIEPLRVDPSADLVTLITCTPIYINTHRLLVRGVRVLGS